MNDNKSYINLILLIFKWRKVYIITFLTVAIVSVIISLLLPKWYRSTAKILVPKQESRGVDISQFLGNIPLDLGAQPAYEVVRLNAILNSRRLLDSVIYKFNLQDVYEEKFLFKTREKLKKYLDVHLDFDEYSITISFIYKNDPEKAAQICQYILEKVSEINFELEKVEAKNNREYIEGIYFETLSRIQSTEDSLKNFQEKYGIFELDEQLKASIETQAYFESQLREAQIQYNLLRKIAGKEMSQLKELELKINVLKKEIENFQNKKSSYSIFTPLKDIPDQALKYYKLKREIQILGKALEFLTPQYFRAKIDERQNQKSFIVLDYPEIPEYKYKPKRAFIVIGTILSSIILLTILIWTLEFINYLKIEKPEWVNKYKPVLKFFRLI